MRYHNLRQRILLLVITSLSLFVSTNASAQQKATMRIHAETVHQRITGFGGFVCSPTFTYGHMSDADIRKVWGEQSTVGCNIMRLYIPIGRNNWSQSLHAAKIAKEMNLIVFASPWGQPAEWKTNGTSNAKNSDGTTGKLKRENWADYAKYLDDYVSYLRQNGVELDAISIQNEPDWPATYAGCLWSASEIAEFVKTYGRQINCKIIAPETLAVSDGYANELAKSSVLPCFDIYGGHQYGGLQTAYKKLGSQGKQLWMTEYLINWNEDAPVSRSFNWDIDAFDFARSINVCLLNDFNAWIHYAAKRYYGMLGDGTNGTTSSVVTKRGYVMAHFAKYVTGLNRIDTEWNDEAQQPLEGSAYLNDDGDTLVAVVFNASKEARLLTLDLPFYTKKGETVLTTKSKNMNKSTVSFDTDECRPCVEIDPSSVVTLRFVKSRDRQVSHMTGTMTRFDKIDDMARTRTSFGTAYRLSGKTVKFDHSNNLLSTQTSNGNGYITLNDRYSQLVMHVRKVSSTLNYTSANTTLYYINHSGKVSSHNYGELDLSSQQNFNLVFDLSPNTLKDGCRGLISITNNNWSSVLTITFGDVYLTNGRVFAANVSGEYVSDDSYMMEYSSDEACSSLDLSGVTHFDDASTFAMANTNAVVYLAEASGKGMTNAVVDGRCESLILSDQGRAYRPADSFMADHAQFTCEMVGYRMLMLPFKVSIPDNVKAYSLTLESEGGESYFQLAAITDSIPAHTPFLAEGDGEITFEGAGQTGYQVSPLGDILRGSYTAIPLYAGDFVLVKKDGQWFFSRLESDETLQPFGVYAQVTASANLISVKDDTSSVTEILKGNGMDDTQVEKYYDMQGRSYTSRPRLGGIYLKRSEDGKIRKMMVR